MEWKYQIKTQSISLPSLDCEMGYRRFNTRGDIAHCFQETVLKIPCRAADSEDSQSSRGLCGMQAENAGCGVREQCLNPDVLTYWLCNFGGLIDLLSLILSINKMRMMVPTTCH